MPNPLHRAPHPAAQLGPIQKDAATGQQGLFGKGIDHKIGRLGTESVTDEHYEARADAAAVSLFKSLDDLRRAVILSEILSPPTHRW